MILLSRRTPALAAAALLATLALTASCGTGAPREPAVAPATPAAAALPPTPWQHEWARGAVFYEVFVRSFQDSNGDGIGDLNGLTSRLDYLNDGDPTTTTDLGVDALWLMPIFASPSYHGYDTTDYEHVNPAYGTDADFDRLVAAAHRRGMKVILDLVLNHSSSQHPWFVDADSSPASAHRDWYVWNPADLGWTAPWGGTNHTWHAGRTEFFYGVFWSGMPDLNWRNPAVRAEMARVARLWLARGVDGFRLDATRHLVENGPGQLQVDQPETHQVLREFAAAVRTAKPDAILVGENWTETPIIATYYGDASRLPGGDELPMSFDFPLAGALVDAAKSERAEPVATVLRAVAEHYPKGALDAPFLTNHDMVRVATVLGSDPLALRSAAGALLTLPGAPFLYYGEELGLENAAGRDDTAKRTPMPWDGTPGGGFSNHQPWFAFAPGQAQTNVAAEASAPDSLLSYYRRLIALRHATPALRGGALELVDTANPAVLGFFRRTGGQTVLVLQNFSRQPQSASLQIAGSLRALGAAGTATASAETKTAFLSGGATGVWEVLPTP